MIRVSVKNWLIFVLISAPFIDLINGAMTFLFEYKGISAGQITRIVFLIINLGILLKIDFKKFIWMFMLCIFLVLQIYIGISWGHINTIFEMFEEIVFDTKFVYGISFIVLISSTVKQGKITKDILRENTIKSTVLLASILILTTLANLNVGSYGDIGSRGLFIEINAISASLLIGLGLQLDVYFGDLYSRRNFFRVAILLIGLFLLGTKASMLFSIFLISYFIFREIFSRKILHSMLAIFIGTLIIIFMIYYFTYGNGVEIIERLVYFKDRMDFISFIFSGRNQTLKNIFSFWISRIYNIVLGTGYNNGSYSIKYLIDGRGSIEMDFFDIYYFYGGIIGTIVLFIFVKLFFKSIIGFIKNKDKSLKSYNLVYIIAIICTMFGGHVIFSPLASGYFAVTFILNKYSKSKYIN